MPQVPERGATDARLRAMARMIWRADTEDVEWLLSLLASRRWLAPEDGVILQNLLDAQPTPA